MGCRTGEDEVRPLTSLVVPYVTFLARDLRSAAAPEAGIDTIGERRGLLGETERSLTVGVVIYKDDPAVMLTELPR